MGLIWFVWRIFDKECETGQALRLALGMIMLQIPQNLTGKCLHSVSFLLPNQSNLAHLFRSQLFKLLTCHSHLARWFVCSCLTCQCYSLVCFLVYTKRPHQAPCLFPFAWVLLILEWVLSWGLSTCQIISWIFWTLFFDRRLIINKIWSLAKFSSGLCCIWVLYLPVTKFSGCLQYWF